MKNKHLLCISIAVAFSANAMGFEIHKGKVISQKQWATDNTIALFSAKNKPAMPILNMGKAASTQATDGYQRYQLMAFIQPLDATIGHDVPIYANNSIMMDNRSDETRDYSIYYRVCVEQSDHRTRCAFSYREISLEKNGSYQDFDAPGLQTTFTKPGQYKLFTDAFLSPAGEPPIATASSEAVIVIS